MKPTVEPGRVVFSKKGRDKGRYFVVLYTVDADFVMICDGETRKLSHLKKKRRKHLAACPCEAPELIELFGRNQLKDSDVRRVLYPIKTVGAEAPESQEG